MWGVQYRGHLGPILKEPLLPALDGNSVAPRLGSVFNWGYSAVLWPLGRGAVGGQDGVDESRKGLLWARVAAARSQQAVGVSEEGHRSTQGPLRAREARGLPCKGAKPVQRPSARGLA